MHKRCVEGVYHAPCLHRCNNLQHNVSSAPNVLYLLLLLYAMGFLEREEAVEMSYGDDTRA